ncbi:autoinducer 2 ABC transporter substrate-binding protein [Frisingicoccus sp.]|uniref:autoinducer 2 ABC transporter substrate-binding protein n=1 Tax=Frisingicoccus sp. TaxID=1918627 RepID=UPI003AB1CAA5
MKKILSVLLACSMLAGILSGCSSGSKETKAETKAETTAETTAASAGETTGKTESDEKYTVAIVVKIMGIAWYDRMQVGIDQFVEDTGMDVYITGADTADPAEQVAVIEDLIAQGVDAMVVIPNSTEAVETVLQKARDKGIVVVTHEATDVKNADYDLEAFNNAEYGQHLMELLAEMMDGEGEYTTFLGALTATSHNEWIDAEVALQEEKYPDMSVVSSKNETTEDSEVAYQKTQEILRTYPNVKGFLGSAMADVPGVARAIEEQGLEDSTYVVGTCLVSTAEQYLESGAIDKITFWDPADAGYALAELCVKVLNGEEISDGVSLTPDGYQNLTVNGNIINGSAWIDVDKDNMGDYDF